MAFLKKIMGKHQHGDAWDDMEFSKIYNLFEEDEEGAEEDN